MTREVSCLVCAAFAVACGSARAPVRETHESRAVAEHQAEPSGPEFDVQGTLGALDSDQVQNTVELQMDRFEQCFVVRMQAVPMIVGRIQMAVRLRTDGSVKWAYVKESTLGDRDTETCLLDVVRATAFRAPTGGEAEFSFPLEWPGTERSARLLHWGAADLGPELAGKVPEVASQCGLSGGVAVTGYVDGAGVLLSAGAAAENPADFDKTQCVIDAVRTWTFSDPTPNVAKVSFSVP